MGGLKTGYKSFGAIVLVVVTKSLNMHLLTWRAFFVTKRQTISQIISDDNFHTGSISSIHMRQRAR